MVQHTESLARQYELLDRAVGLGWPAHQVVVIDADRTDFHGRHSSEMIARLIGHEKDEIQLYRQ